MVKKLVYGVLLVGVCVLGLALDLQQRAEEGAKHHLPIHEMSLAELSKGGPGQNPHISLTGFQAGKPVVTKLQTGVWTAVWVPLFVPGRGSEVKVILHSIRTQDQAELDRLTQSSRLKGVCAPFSSHADGSAEWRNVEAYLREANPGASMSNPLFLENDDYAPKD